MENLSILMYVLLIIGVLIIVLLLGREINCWYWKINKRIDLFQEQNRLLTSILEKINTSPSTISQDKQDEIKLQAAEIKIDLIYLNGIIETEKKKGAFGKSNRQEIINYIDSFCKSKEDCIRLIEDYQKQYNKNIIDELKNISKGYDAIKENLRAFILFNVVKSDYPHDLKV
jgi:hypothetical protein